MRIELLAFEKQFLVLSMQGKTLGDWGHQQTKTKLQYVGRIPHLFPCQRWQINNGADCDWNYEGRIVRTMEKCTLDLSMNVYLIINSWQQKTRTLKFNINQKKSFGFQSHHKRGGSRLNWSAIHPRYLGNIKFRFWIISTLYSLANFCEDCELIGSTLRPLEDVARLVADEPNGGPTLG